jgi:hypothetical protein
MSRDKQSSGLSLLPITQREFDAISVYLSCKVLYFLTCKLNLECSKSYGPRIGGYACLWGPGMKQVVGHLKCLMVTQTRPYLPLGC